MALSQELLIQIHNAFSEAMSTINTVGEVVWDTPENRQIVQRFLLHEGIPQTRWISSFIVQSAILECRKNGVLTERPAKKTRQEREAELHARDAADGSSVGNAHSHYEPRAKATEEETAKAKQWYDELRDPVTANRKKAAEKADAEAAAANEQRQLMELFQDPSVEFADYTPEQLAAFKKLTPANMKLIGARRDDYKRGKAQEAAAARRKSQ